MFADIHMRFLEKQGDRESREDQESRESEDSKKEGKGL
jgi:hypothetical protein